MNGQRIRKISICLVAALYLLACVSPFAVAPTAYPTQAPEMLGTIIAQTAAVAQTQTAIFLPTITLTPTSAPTLIPTKTPTPTPTFIPFGTLATKPVTETVTPTGTIVTTQAGADSSSDGTSDENDGTSNDRQPSDYSSVIDKEWACTVLAKSIPNGAVIGRGARFYAAWTLLNRGVRTWPVHSVDFLFKAGFRNEGRARYDLPSEVVSGATITLHVAITAPKDPGAYRSIWTLKVGRTSFCQMGINFVVK